MIRIRSLTAVAAVAAGLGCADTNAPLPEPQEVLLVVNSTATVISRWTILPNGTAVANDPLTVPTGLGDLTFINSPGGNGEKPDLIPLALNRPALALAGQATTLTYTVTNAGVVAEIGRASCRERV